jgi:hypothetical protein
MGRLDEGASIPKIDFHCSAAILGRERHGGDVLPGGGPPKTAFFADVLRGGMGKTYGALSNAGCRGGAPTFGPHPSPLRRVRLVTCLLSSDDNLGEDCGHIAPIDAGIAAEIGLALRSPIVQRRE